MNDANLALVFTGGGARAAYQVGFLRHLASRYPDLAPGILTGVSAGGMIATHLASRQERFVDAVDRLADIWRHLRVDDLCRVDPVDLMSRLTRWGLRMIAGVTCSRPKRRSLADTEPLRALLARMLQAGPDGRFDRIARNLDTGVVRSVAVTAWSYATGQSVTWAQSRGRFDALLGDGVRREGLAGSLSVDHLMASGALPFIFPSVQVDDVWYGDGGIRLTAPLAPAIELGARKIIAVALRHSDVGERRPHLTGHPQPARVAGTLLDALFLDLLDHDVARIQQFNAIINRLPAATRTGLRHVDVLVLRPSQDLGRLANDFEADLPRGFRLLLRALGSRDTRSNDLFSLLMFQKDYLERLIDLGEADARRRGPEIEAFLESDPRPTPSRRRPALAAAAGEALPQGFVPSRRNARLEAASLPTPALAG